jgi:hypothetical protein
MPTVFPLVAAEANAACVLNLRKRPVGPQEKGFQRYAMED